jgi:hypothetical protein
MLEAIGITIAVYTLFRYAEKIVQFASVTPISKASTVLIIIAVVAGLVSLLMLACMLAPTSATPTG